MASPAHERLRGLLPAPALAELPLPTLRAPGRELRHRLSDVERKGWRKPKTLTFAAYAETWFAEGEKRRRWKPNTVAQYRSVRERLVEEFGTLPLEAIRPRHVAAYVAAMSDTYGAATVSRDVSVLHAILRTAQREELVTANAATAAERPKLPRRQWRILQPHEVRTGRPRVHRRPTPARLLDARTDGRPP